MIKFVLAFSLTGSIAFADQKPVCSEAFAKATAQSRLYFLAENATSVVLFGGGVFGVLTRGWRLRGFGGIAASVMAGGMATLEAKRLDFLKALTQSVAEAERNVVGPYTRVLAQYINSAIYDDVLFESKILGTQPALSKQLRVELAQALDNNQVTPQDVLVATQKLIDTNAFCLTTNTRLASAEWTEMIVWELAKSGTSAGALAPVSAAR